MKLEDMSEIWGCSVQEIKKYAKRCRKISFLVYVIDIVLCICACLIMYVSRVQFNQYVLCIVGLGILFSLIMGAFIDQKRWDIYKFYRWHRKKDVEEIKLDIDSNKMFSVLFCAGYSKVKDGKSLDFYKDLLLSQCQNQKFARKCMKYLMKYKSDEEGSLSCWILKDGRHYYFIGFSTE